jgi:hypothetical protein
MHGLQQREQGSVGGHTEFFRLTLSHETLFNYYQTNFAMMQHHKYSLTELEDMMPWEREIYVMLLIRHLEEENERLKQQKG